MKCSFEPLFRVFCVMMILAESSSAKTWTDIQERTIEAEFVSADSANVTLRLKGGKEVTLELSRLSKEDQEFVRAQSEKKDEPVVPVEDANFKDPWPTEVRFKENPEIVVVEENKEEKRFVYESANFRFNSDVRLSVSLVRGFAVMFESTYQYCRALPLGLSGGKRTDGKFQILLFENKDDYIKAGAPPRSAGVFVSSKSAVMVPLENLGVKKQGSGYTLDRRETSAILIHEITHQLTPAPYFSPGSMGWFTEGIAEYVAATPYRNGLFKVRSNFDDIAAYVTEYGKEGNGGRGMGKKITAPSLKDFLAMDYIAYTGDQANFNYGFGLILTTYFFRLDGEGDGARIKEFLKALRAGKRGEQALEVLMAGMTYEEMEAAITKGWRSKGIRIEFPEPVKAASIK
jgi:hypothetical protein